MDKAGRETGFLQMDNRIVTEYAARIGLSGLAVYAALCRFADATTRTCYPSHYTLARILGVSRTTVIRAIGRLEEAGLIAVKRQRAAKGDPKVNEYTLLSLGRKNRESPQVPARVAGRGSSISVREAVQEVDQGSPVSAPGAVHQIDHPSTVSVREQDLINKTQFNNSECSTDGPQPGRTLTGTEPARSQPRQDTEARPRQPSPHPGDPNLIHPAVQIYGKHCKLALNQTQAAEIAATVSDWPRWEQVLGQWLLAGYRPNNVAGMLDWYKHGIPERSHGHGNNGAGSGFGSFGRRAGGGYKQRPPETPEERARLDAEWESFVRQSRGMAGEGAPAET